GQREPAGHHEVRSLRNERQVLRIRDAGVQQRGAVDIVGPIEIDRADNRAGDLVLALGPQRQTDRGCRVELAVPLERLLDGDIRRVDELWHGGAGRYGGVDVRLRDLE